MIFPDSWVILSEWWVLQYIQIHELYRNVWSFSISRYTSYTKMVGPSVYPDTRNHTKMVGFSKFPGPNHARTTDDPYFTLISRFFPHVFHILDPNSNSSLLNTKDLLRHPPCGVAANIQKSQPLPDVCGQSQAIPPWKMSEPQVGLS